MKRAPPYRLLALSGVGLLLALASLDSVPPGRSQTPLVRIDWNQVVQVLGKPVLRDVALDLPNGGAR
jgi:hypothetical protein